MKLLLVIPSQQRNNLAIQLPHLGYKDYEQKSKGMFVTLTYEFAQQNSQTTHLSLSSSLSSLFHLPCTNVSSNFLAKLFSQLF